MLQQDSNKMFPYDYINLTLKQKFILPQLFVAGLLAIAIYELKKPFSLHLPVRCKLVSYCNLRIPKNFSTLSNSPQL